MDAYLGIILPSPYNFAPVNWQFCAGQILSIAANNALFALLGTTYGGNGSSTFGLPDLRGRVIVGSSQMGTPPGLSGDYALGEMAGTENVTILTSQLPPHVHSNTLTGFTATGSMPTATSGTTNVPGGTTGVPATLARGTNSYGASSTATPITVNVAITGAGGANTGSTGGGLPTPILQPYTALCYIIAMSGIFPSRG